MKINRILLLILLALAALSPAAQTAQNVIIVVIDGVRYSESLGAKAAYMPHVWNDLRPQGTIYTNFRNEGMTLTCPGHAALLTGNWQKIANDGSQEFSDPTLFEYLRKQAGLPEQSCAVVSGKAKLHILTHSNNHDYGSQDQAALIADDLGSNLETWKKLSDVMTKTHPRAIIVNFAETDIKGHAGKWEPYLDAVRGVDSLVWILWKQVQSDSIYRNTTTVFITNDHGRHDDQHGGFKSHGDSCEGCRHIMLLALGPQFKPGAEVPDAAYQIDVAPTAAEILGISLPQVQGRSLLIGQSGRPKK